METSEQKSCKKKAHKADELSNDKFMMLGFFFFKSIGCEV